MKRKVVIKKDLIAEEEARLLKLVHANPGLSRREIATRMRLSTAAAGYYVDRLLKDRFLLTGESVKSGRGRPKAPLYLNEKIGCFLGLDISGTYIRAACLDFASNLLFQHIETLPDDTPNDEVYPILVKLIHTLRKKPMPAFMGIGLAVPVINKAVPHFAPLKLHDVGLLPIAKIAQQLSDALTVPVTHESSINALGYGEMHYGAGLRWKNCVSILARTEVNASVTIDGRLQDRGRRGSSGMIGQWGCPKYLLPKQTGAHLDLAQASSQIAFPQEIPVEQVASIWGLRLQIKLALESGRKSLLQSFSNQLSLESIRRAYCEGDRLVTQHVTAAAVSLAWAISQLVQLFDPERVILSGPITIFGQAFLDCVREQTASRLKGTPWDPAQVEYSEMGEYSVAIGAAASALDKWQPAR